MTELSTVDLDLLEPLMMGVGKPMPCPVVHHFSPGIYIREVTIPKGAMALGHKQRFEHLNVVLKGAVAVYDDGAAKVIQAPLMFVGKPGRKIGVCLEDCVWQNIYPNPDNERDIEKLEARYLEKSDFVAGYEQKLTAIRSESKQEDRDDFYAAIAELGFSPDAVRAESEITADIVEIPAEYAGIVSLRNSPIEGRGLFVSSAVTAGALIAPARIGSNRTIAGRFVNHSKNPNCHYAQIGADVWLVASKDIEGCVAGSHGSELTVDYREAFKLSGRKALK